MNQHREWTATLIRKLAVEIYGSISVTNEIIDKRAALYAAIDVMEAENAELRNEAVANAKQLAAFRLSKMSTDAIFANLNQKVSKFDEAVATLQSERDANAILSAEIAALKRLIDLDVYQAWKDAEAENAKLKSRLDAAEAKLADLDAQPPIAYMYTAEGFATAFSVTRIPPSVLSGEVCERALFAEPKPASVPDIVQKMMVRLADLLDEDQFAGMNDLVASAGYQPPAAPKLEDV